MSSRVYRIKGESFSTALRINVVHIHSDLGASQNPLAKQSLLGGE